MTDDTRPDLHILGEPHGQDSGPSDPTACRRCGQIHPRCAGHNRRGGPCGEKPQAGQRVCHLHGGKSPQALAAAERRLQMGRAETELRRLGHPIDADPAGALLGAVREAAGNVAALRRQVSELDSPTQPVFVAGGGVNIAEHVLAELYRVWCDRLVSYAAAALRAGIEERRVQVEERFATAVALGFEQLLASPVLGLSWEVREAGRAEAARILLELDSPAA